MTYGDLDTISKKIQNRCGLEAPTKHTFFRDEEGKIYIKFWFDSLKLPDYLKDEEEKLNNDESRRITNTFSNNVTYTHEDDFEIVEFNTNDGWVKVLPDDQKFKITESRLKEEDEALDRQPHALIYWPTQFCGGGNPELTSANEKFFHDAIAWVQENYKTKKGEPYKTKIIIANTKEGSQLINTTMMEGLDKIFNLDQPDAFLVSGTAGIIDLVEQGLDKENSIVLNVPGVDYTKDLLGLKEKDLPAEIASQIKNIHQLEDKLMNELVEEYTKEVLEPYIKYKMNEDFSRWDEQYRKEHSDKEVQTTEQDNQQGTQQTDQNNQTGQQGTPAPQPAQESYKKNLLYRVYKLIEEEDQNPPAETQTTTTGDEGKIAKGLKKVANNQVVYPQYVKARDWYTANLDTNESQNFTAISSAIINKCPTKSEIVEEMGKAKKWEEAIGIELVNKFKGLGMATLGQVKEALGDMKNGSISKGLGRLKDIVDPGSQSKIEAEGVGQINVTTQTNDLQAKDLKVDTDIGIINIIYTSLFKNAGPCLDKIKKTFNLKMSFNGGE